MMRLLLLLISCATLFAQRTPLKVNGTVVSNPDFVDTVSITWSVNGSSIEGVSVGGDTIWTNDNGTISANSTNGLAYQLNGTNLFKIYPTGGVGLNSEWVEYWWGDPARGEFIIEVNGEEFAGTSRFLAQYFDDDIQREVDIAANVGGSYIAVGFPIAAQFAPGKPDGVTPHLLDTWISHTTGNLLEVKNAGTTKVSISSDGGLDFFDDTQSDYIVEASTESATGGWLAFYYSSQFNGAGPTGQLTADVYADYCSFIHGIGAGSGGNIDWTLTSSDALFAIYRTTNKGLLVNPTAAAGDTPYAMRTEITHTSGNILDVENNGTDVFTVTSAGRTITPSAPPANASAPGVAGSYTWDANFFYTCVATDTWKRVAIATW